MKPLRCGWTSSPTSRDSLVGGAFQCYALNNVMIAQLFAAAKLAHPSIPTEIEQGSFDTLRGWLRENVHRHGRMYTPSGLIERATHAPLGIALYIGYLQAKFGELYDLY